MTSFAIMSEEKKMYIYKIDPQMVMTKIGEDILMDRYSKVYRSDIGLVFIKI